MKRNFLILFLVSTLLAYQVFAGNTAGNPVIANLLQDKRPVSFVSWQRENYLSTFDASFNGYPQNLIKCGGDLYVFINGSGRLYKVTTSDRVMNFTRVDSTTNFGYNIGSFGFSYNNRIYNLGGYGYWRMNGQLRVFNEKASQWDIVKLNKEIPLLTGKTEGMLWYDVAGKKIYTAYYLVRDEAIKTKDLDETQFVYDVMVLDLQKAEWIRLGSLNSFLKGKLQIVKPMTMGPWGQMISIGDKISLLDFKNNQILSLDVRKEQYQSLIREGWGCSFYFKDSTLFYGNNNSLDSVVMHHSDFISTNEQLYTKEDSSFFTGKSGNYLLLTIPIALMGISIVVFKKQQSKKAKNIKNGFDLTNMNHPAQTVFDEMEIQLLQLLIQNTSAGITTSTDEQNKVLGLVKKNAEI
ncbi:MAG: hypothetical protein Q8L07_14625 [Sediminibacterium sp.]|nr:hypothetical protein [Sediminibacterium sp.]